MTTEYESTVLFDDMSRRPGESFDLLAQSGTSLYLGGTSTTLLNVTLGDAQISGSAAPLREGAKRMASVGEASSFMPTDWSKRDGESFDLMGQSGTDFLAGLTGGDSMASFGGHLVFGADEDRLQQLESAGAEGDRLIDVPAPTPRPASKVLAPVHPATRAPPLSSDGADDSLMDFATPAPRRLLSSLATPAQRLTRHEAMEQLSLMDPTPAMSNRTLPVLGTVQRPSVLPAPLTSSALASLALPVRISRVVDDTPPRSATRASKSSTSEVSDAGTATPMVRNGRIVDRSAIKPPSSSILSSVRRRGSLRPTSTFSENDQGRPAITRTTSMQTFAHSERTERASALVGTPRGIAKSFSTTAISATSRGTPSTIFKRKSLLDLAKSQSDQQSAVNPPKSILRRPDSPSKPSRARFFSPAGFGGRKAAAMDESAEILERADVRKFVASEAPARLHFGVDTSEESLFSEVSPVDETVPAASEEDLLRSSLPASAAPVDVHEEPEEAGSSPFATFNTPQVAASKMQPRFTIPPPSPNPSSPSRSARRTLQPPNATLAPSVSEVETTSLSNVTSLDFSTILDQDHRPAASPATGGDLSCLMDEGGSFLLANTTYGSDFVNSSPDKSSASGGSRRSGSGGEEGGVTRLLSAARRQSVLKRFEEQTKPEGRRDLDTTAEEEPKVESKSGDDSTGDFKALAKKVYSEKEGKTGDIDDEAFPEAPFHLFRDPALTMTVELSPAERQARDKDHLLARSMPLPASPRREAVAASFQDDEDPVTGSASASPSRQALAPSPPKMTALERVRAELAKVQERKVQAALESARKPAAMSSAAASAPTQAVESYDDEFEGSVVLPATTKVLRAPTAAARPAASLKAPVSSAPARPARPSSLTGRSAAAPSTIRPGVRPSSNAPAKNSPTTGLTSKPQPPSSRPVQPRNRETVGRPNSAFARPTSRAPVLATNDENRGRTTTTAAASRPTKPTTTTASARSSGDVGPPALGSRFGFGLNRSAANTATGRVSLTATGAKSGSGASPPRKARSSTSGAALKPLRLGAADQKPSTRTGEVRGLTLKARNGGDKNQPDGMRSSTVASSRTVTRPSSSVGSRPVAASRWQ